VTKVEYSVTPVLDSFSLRDYHQAFFENLTLQAIFYHSPNALGSDSIPIFESLIFFGLLISPSAKILCLCFDVSLKKERRVYSLDTYCRPFSLIMTSPLFVNCK